MATKKLPYQDKAGNWRDAKGRFTKLRPSTDKKQVIFKDKKGRWHLEKGGFTKLRPAPEKIERTKASKDILGRFTKRPPVRVVEEYIEPEPEPYIPPEKPERPVRRRIPVYHRQIGDRQQYSEAEREPLDRYMNTSEGNREDPSTLTRRGELRVPMIFEKSFIGTLRKSPFEADEVSIFRYGLVIRPREATVWSDDLQVKLEELLSEYPNSSMHVVDEGSTFAIRVNLGSTRRSTDADEISRDLARADTILGDIYFEIEQAYGNTDWFVFWDTNIEMVYE